MQLSILASAIAALAAGAHAAAVQCSPYNVASLRLYSTANCSQPGNQGEWTIHATDVNKCIDLTSTGGALAYQYLAIDGSSFNNQNNWWSDCTLSYYTDSSCSEGQTAFATGCTAAPTGSSWGSGQVACT